MGRAAVASMSRHTSTSLRRQRLRSVATKPGEKLVLFNGFNAPLSGLPAGWTIQGGEAIATPTDPSAILQLNLPLATPSNHMSIQVGYRIDNVSAAATQADAGVVSFIMLPLGTTTIQCTGTRTGPESAQEDLDEAWEIAERGPMKLFMADIYLHRARLFFREKPYPWKSAQEDLVAAEKLIKTCGYHRRDQELADAKGAILAA